jgi:hypothetical protein
VQEQVLSFLRFLPHRKENNDKKPGIYPFECEKFPNGLKRFCCSVKIITLLLWGNRRKTQCGLLASVGVPVGCVRIAKAALRYCTCVVLPSENVRKIFV